MPALLVLREAGGTSPLSHILPAPREAGGTSQLIRILPAPREAGGSYFYKKYLVYQPRVSSTNPLRGLGVKSGTKNYVDCRRNSENFASFQ